MTKKTHRIVVVNDEIYLLSESVYKKFYNRKEYSPEDKNYDKKHTAKINFVRKHGKLFGYADRMLRND